MIEVLDSRTADCFRRLCGKLKQAGVRVECSSHRDEDGEPYFLVVLYGYMATVSWEGSTMRRAVNKMLFGTSWESSLFKMLSYERSDYYRKKLLDENGGELMASLLEIAAEKPAHAEELDMWLELHGI